MALILLPTVELEPSGWAEPGYDALIATAQWGEFWAQTLSLGDGEGLWLDIGHGNWSAHREGASVLLTETPEQKGFEPVTTSISADELLAATYDAERALEAFRLRLLPILHRVVEDRARAERLSMLMVGLPIR